MKDQQNKTLCAILAILLLLPCFFVSCAIANGDETTESSEDNNQPSGYDYSLTAADLDEINTAYAEKYNVKKMNYLRSLEEATVRKPRVFFYFGKYGDTLVIWRHYDPVRKCCFTMEGYEFNFYIGTVWFIKNGKLYYHDELPIEGLMTEEEAKDFHNAYTVHYLPLVRKEYAVAKYISGIEIPSEDEMVQINDAYEKWSFDKLYNEYILRNGSDKEDAAYKYAYSIIGYDPHRFFNEYLFEDYHYYGQIGGKVFLAAETSSRSFVEYVSGVPGYTFVYSGYSSGPLVYADGVVSELFEAYQNGIVSESEIAELHKRYLEYYNYFAGGRKKGLIPGALKIAENDDRPSPIKLTNKEKREIVWEYIDSDKLDYTYGIRCYGKFDGGAYAVMIDGPYMYTQALETERVADYEFKYNSSQKIKIYKDGNFYTLNEAYLMGIISKSDVASIQWDKTVIQD